MALTQISTQGIKDGTITGTDLATNVDLVDDQKLRLGNSNDLQIYHDGSNSYIQDTDQGNLFIEASAVLIRKNGTTENIAKFIQDGAVELYYDNSKKLETAADRVNIYGHVFAIGGNYYLSNGFQDAYARFRNTGGSNDANFEFFVRDSGTETEALEITKDAHIRIPNDNKKLKFGAGDDLQIYHNGTHSYIDETQNGNLVLRTNPSGTYAALVLQAGQENSVICHKNGNVELYYDNSKKLETNSTGIHIFGNTGHADGAADLYGSDNDLIIKHDGSNSKITHNGTGHFFIETEGSGEDLYLQANDDVRIRTAGNKNAIICNKDGSVELYHNNSKQFETTSTGSTTFGTHHSTSDIALKTNIKPITNTLEKIQQITGYKYKFIKSNENSIGVVAQEVEKVFPELVAGTEGNKTLQYNGLIGVLIEAVKELSAEVAALKAS